MAPEPDIKRWTAKRKAELIKQIYKGQTTVPEAARRYDLTQLEVEKWMSDAATGMESVLKASPKVNEHLVSRVKRIINVYRTLVTALLPGCCARTRTSSSVCFRLKAGRCVSAVEPGHECKHSPRWPRVQTSVGHQALIVSGTLLLSL